ncbi:putative AUT2/APG4/ATG4 cysteine peptidase [Trypanosoma grayi]|uniref:putative AUT2/APG4/ATG4 cysteine peptidase n=1 Tax=Trypanosoma grayi TaxID=71804 RepID=UPI0004F426AC|nr:putative AUT2/APG4/ATG4 cysteine peptidase [Trypanosoma grayi]KEG09425.1 putative AUT2/APG4/ATG4 cysteine peptidase [Trypanosoma grayi]
MGFLHLVLNAIYSGPRKVVYPCRILDKTIPNEEGLNNVVCQGFLILTYRRNFSPLPNSALTSDQGWGCLARASQMLLARALWCHSPSDFQLEYFRDLDSPQGAPFSLHNMVRGVSAEGSDFRNEYWPPSQGCKAIRWCVDEAVKRGILSCGMEVVVALGGCVSLDNVCKHLEANCAVLILVPVRSGTSRCITQTMFWALEHVLYFSSCVGVVGGVPNRSYYILGTCPSGMLYLDPHCVTKEALLTCDEGDTAAAIPTASDVKCVEWHRVDTSFFIGFYVASMSAWQEFQKQLENVERQLAVRILSVMRNESLGPCNLDIGDWPSCNE